MCTALCAYATDMTFGVAVDGTHVTVTPSVDDETYFCASVDDATFSLVIENIPDSIKADSIDFTLPENLFLIAKSFYWNSIYTGVQTLTCRPGHQYLVMCAAEPDSAGIAQATGAITVQEVTLTANTDDELEIEPLTFIFEPDNESFTVTPSDNEQEYVAVVAPKELQDQMMAMLGLNIDEYIAMMAQFGQLTPYIYQGVTTHNVKEYADKDEVFPDGLYEALVFGVKRDGNSLLVTSEIYQYDWNVTFTTTGISNVEAAAMVGKMLKDGKFVINGRVGLDGKVIR